ncbi:MAG: PH domain-containing protein [Chloroflexi bacterium]|nr:PH domain-containing protein [Chloroflexota bacterium]
MAGYVESLLGEREKIILIAHQHWFILVRAIVLEIIIILILIALTIIAGANLSEFALLIGAVGTILLLLPLSTMIRDILDWTNRQYIVTNRRVIQISGILSKNVTDSSLVKVTDVKMEQSAFGRLFNYGDIEILTASEFGVNLFRRIEEPIVFKTTMLNAKERLEQGDGADPPTEDILEIIASLDRLRDLGILSEEEFNQKKEELLARL